MGKCFTSLFGRDPCPARSREAGSEIYTMRPIGVVVRGPEPGHRVQSPNRTPSTIRILPEFTKGLDGLAACERLDILYLFDRARPFDGALLQHPQGDEAQPLRGVFALRSPNRPNPIGLCTVQLLDVKGDALTVSGLDAWEGTPILDIKPHVA